MHSLEEGDYFGAAETLKSLAEEESEMLSRKKTMLSLAKLSALASGADEEEESEATMSSAATTRMLDSVDHQLWGVSAQECLPDAALRAYGVEDRASMKVLTPREVIELHVGPDNPEADVADFKRALDMLDHVNVGAADAEEDLALLRLHIFARAVLRDDWKSMDVDDPASAAAGTVFFRLADLCHLQWQVRFPVLYVLTVHVFFTSKY